MSLSPFSSLLALRTALSFPVAGQRENSNFSSRPRKKELAGGRGRESTVFRSSEGWKSHVDCCRPSTILIWVVLLALGALRLCHGRSSGQAVLKLVLQFINLGSSPNNRQDFQHPSSSLASKSTTKKQRQHSSSFLYSFPSHQLLLLDATSQPDRSILQFVRKFGL